MILRVHTVINVRCSGQPPSHDLQEGLDRDAYRVVFPDTHCISPIPAGWKAQLRWTEQEREDSVSAGQLAGQEGGVEQLCAFV